MAKIVVFSGSHGVGKTSLINKISNNPFDLVSDDYKIFKEINTGLFNIGYSLNGAGFSFDEVIFSQKQAFDLGYNLVKYYSHASDNRLIISDRSCVDTYLYTSYFLSKSNDTLRYTSLINEMYEKSIEILPHMLHFLVPPFSDFESLLDRMSIQQRDDVWQMFVDFFEKHNKSSSSVILSSDNTDDRYAEAYEILLKYLHNKDVKYDISFVS